LHLSVSLFDPVVIRSYHGDILSGHEDEVVYIFDFPQPLIIGASCTRPSPVWNFGSTKMGHLGGDKIDLGSFTYSWL